MPRRFKLVLCFMLLSSSVASAAQRDSVAPEAMPRSGTSASWNRMAAEPPVTFLKEGDRAPLFSYLGTDGKWHKFSELISQNAVLLVFGATDPELNALEAARPGFDDLGIKTIAVVDMRASAAARLSERLHLSTPLISDPMRAIGQIYNCLDPVHQRHSPSFFVLDNRRTIRAIGRGSIPPAVRLLAVSANALGKELPSSQWTPESDRRTIGGGNSPAN